MSQGDSSFVLTTPLGSKIYELDDIQANNDQDDSGKGKQSDGFEDYWPRVPVSFQPPPAHLEKAVREVGYISFLLRSHIPPRPQDDMSCISDLMLSLETRSDITQLVLDYTSINDRLMKIPHLRKGIPREQDDINLISRAKALQAHWRALTSNDAEDPRADVSFPPFLTDLPNDKPPGWKLEFTDNAREDAEKIFSQLRSERHFSSVFFHSKPPKPMAWHPNGDHPFDGLASDMLKSGNMYHRRDWLPIYTSFELQIFDLPIMWKNPEWDDDQNQTYYFARTEHTNWKTQKDEEVLKKEDTLKSA